MINLGSFLYSLGDSKRLLATPRVGCVSVQSCVTCFVIHVCPSGFEKAIAASSRLPRALRLSGCHPCVSVVNGGVQIGIKENPKGQGWRGLPTRQIIFTTGGSGGCGFGRGC